MKHWAMKKNVPKIRKGKEALVLLAGGMILKIYCDLPGRQPKEGGPSAPERSDFSDYCDIFITE
jgi:hypothetical protein